MNRTIKKIGTIVCFMATLVATLSSCSKEETQIVGAWEMTYGTEQGEEASGEIWTFNEDKTFLISFSGGRIQGSYVIENNSLTMEGEGEYFGVGNFYPYTIKGFFCNFSIIEIKKDEMILSGTEQFEQYFYTIDYTENVSNSGQAMFRRQK